MIAKSGPLYRAHEGLVNYVIPGYSNTSFEEEGFGLLHTFQIGIMDQGPSLVKITDFYTQQ